MLVRVTYNLYLKIDNVKVIQPTLVSPNIQGTHQEL